MASQHIQHIAGLFVAVALMGCVKENRLDPATLANPSEYGVAKIGGTDWTLVRDENGPRCPMPSTNCTRIVLLRTNDDYGVGAVLVAIATGNQTTIIEEFVAQKESLVEVMHEADINDVIDGELVATADLSADGEVHFIILSTTSGGVRIAYQFDYE